MEKANSLAKWFKEKLEEFKDDPEFIAEGIILKLNEKIVIKMEELNITRAELARRLDVTKPFVTKLLNGNHNITVKTMVSIAKALECELMLDLYPKGFEQKTFYREVTEPRDLNKLESKEDRYASAA